MVRFAGQERHAAQIYDKWVTNIPKWVGSSFPPSLTATFNLTGFNGSDFGSWPRSDRYRRAVQTPALQRRLSEFAE